MIDFFIPMEPPTITAQEHKLMVRNGRAFFYDPPKLRAARKKLESCLVPYKPNEPFREGVSLVTKWCFPRGKHADGEYRITRPDTDNLQKLLKDCMTRVGFWEDDALVCQEVTEKFWAEIPGIYIAVMPVRRE